MNRSLKPKLHLIISSLLIVLFCSIVLTGCKFMTVVKNKAASSSSGEVNSTMDDENFNPDQYVDGIWADKVIPYMNNKAKPISDVLTALTSDAEKAGKTFGIRVDEKSPWNFIVKGKVKAIRADTASQAGLLDVELIPNDSQISLMIAIGPVFKKTAIRDSLDFIQFDDFKNQIQFAKLSNAFNKKVKDQVIGKLNVMELAGKELDLVGVMTMDAPGKFTLMPVSLLTAGGGQ
jgi:predicted lipoprotein